MKSNLQSLGAVIFILFVVGCATKIVNSIADSEPVPTKQEVLANFSEIQLSQGKAYFESRCNQCHKLFDPDSRDPAQWNKVLRRMLPKTNLTYDEGKLVRAYLVANSK